MLRELFSSGKGLLLTCSAYASPRWRLLLQSSALGHVPSVAAPRLQSAGSVAVVLGLSCSSARGISWIRGSGECFKWSPAWADPDMKPPGKSLPCGMTDAFLMISLGSRSGEENHGSVKCQSPQPHQGYMLSTGLLMLTLNSWLRQGLSVSLTTNLLFLSLSCCSF